MQLPTLRKVGFRFRFSCNPTDPGLRRILLLMLPATIGLSATQINIFVNTNFAASCVEGSVSWLNYAFRLVQLPIGVFGVALSIAIMPVLAKQAAEKDMASLKQTFTSSLVLVFTLAVPATAGLMLLSVPIIRLIFEHGAFTAADTLQTADALTFYAVGLFAYSAIKVMVPVFYAIGNTKYPVIGSFFGVAVNILTITLVIDSLQHRGIALSTSCAMILNFLFLSVILYRKLSGYPLVYLLKGLAKIIAATALMSGGIWCLQRALLAWLDGPMLAQIAALIVLIGAGGGDLCGWTAIAAFAGIHPADRQTGSAFSQVVEKLQLCQQADHCGIDMENTAAHGEAVKAMIDEALQLIVRPAALWTDR